MKTTGWILLIFGALSFLGAASKGNSVFGPLFWIALGAYLIYRANNKSNDQHDIVLPPDSNFKEISEDSQQDGEIESTIPNIETANEPTTEQATEPQLESLEEIQSQLTMQKREAAMCLIYFFSGYNKNLLYDTASLLIVKQARTFFGISLSALELTTKYPADNLIEIILTIKSRKAKEFLLLTCYDLIRNLDNTDAYNDLFNIGHEMGYDHFKLVKLIESYK